MVRNNTGHINDIESQKKSITFPKFVELIFSGELNCLQGCFRKQTGMEDV